MSESDERPLWLTLPGASPWVAVGWVAWVGAVGVMAALVAPVLGPAGPLIGILAGGWLLARRMPMPVECFRRYHLDRDELTVMGPGRIVQRLPWDQVRSLTQGRHALELAGPGLSAALPVDALYDTDTWFEVLGRVVPTVAADLWAVAEDGEFRLMPPLDPPTRSLAWWAYVPAVTACLVGVGIAGAILTVALAAGERLVSLLRARRGAVTVQPDGVSFRAGRAGAFAPWSNADAAPAAGGLRVTFPRGGSELVPASLPNFWPAAAVIQLRAKLGPDCPAVVYFRVHLQDGGLAVIGEVEASG
jgi:hypothetical protein